jgi:hypothetical protein
MLRGSEHAAYCFPTPDQVEPTQLTEELDHLLAMHFGWWDVLIAGKAPFEPLPALGYARSLLDD